MPCQLDCLFSQNANLVRECEVSQELATGGDATSAEQLRTFFLNETSGYAIAESRRWMK